MASTRLQGEIRRPFSFVDGSTYLGGVERNVNMCTCFERQPIFSHLQELFGVLGQRIPGVAPESTYYGTIVRQADDRPRPAASAPEHNIGPPGDLKGHCMRVCPLFVRLMTCSLK